MKSSWRINFILGFFVFAGILIVSRLAWLQIFNAQTYRALAKGQQEFFESPQQERGEIFLNRLSEEPIKVALNKNWWKCYASPKEILDISKASDSLSDLLDIDKEILMEKLNNDSSYYLLKEKMSEEEMNRIKKMDIKGIHFSLEKYRYYPYQELASDVLGFVNQDFKGEYGIEKYYNYCLIDDKEWLRRKISPYGYSLEESSSIEKGCDVYLTIDKNIQLQAEGLLAQAKEEYEIEGGQIIVLDPNTGRILAMAEYPFFNPNKYGESNLQTLKNGAVQDLFEPGSMFKAITMASALNEKVITEETTYEDKGSVTINGRKLSNFHGKVFGVVNMTQVLEKSINTGAVFAESKIGNKTFLKYLEKFGVFEKTNIELPGESYSKNTVLKSGRDVNFATAAFGQGIDMTPVNLVRAFSILANGGKLINLHIVDSVKEGAKITKTETKVLKQGVISKDTLNQLTKMLVQVTESGYGKKAKVPGYYVAGKTGTSQIPFTSLGISKAGYSEKTWQSFIGFYPAFEPKFLMLVKLDNPNTSTAEYSAAPIFGKLAQYILNYYKVPPDYEEVEEK
ncbi:MAG: penicillin-binding protein 2 [Candidatus Pacebacteria bacterium]|nr:penicillin-binding protein 2 [Candidatus Paceibacterota bacterium]